MSKNFGVTMSEYKVVNMKNKYHEIVTYFLGIYIGIKMTSTKYSVKKKAIHFSIPRPISFPKAIKRFLNVTNKVKVIFNIAKRLFHVDLFMQILMQEVKFSIHLMDLPFK
jgi:hypothetical protein